MTIASRIYEKHSTNLPALRSHALLAADIIESDDEFAFCCWFRDCTWMRIDWQYDIVEYSPYPNASGYASASLL